MTDLTSIERRLRDLARAEEREDPLPARLLAAVLEIPRTRPPARSLGRMRLLLVAAVIATALTAVVVSGSVDDDHRLAPTEQVTPRPAAPRPGALNGTSWVEASAVPPGAVPVEVAIANARRRVADDGGELLGPPDGIWFGHASCSTGVPWCPLIDQPEPLATWVLVWQDPYAAFLIDATTGLVYVWKSGP